MKQKILSLTFAATLTSMAALAQAPPTPKPLTPADRPDVETLSRTVQALRRGAQMNADAGTQADKLLQEAASSMSAGLTGEARRKLAQAQSIVASSGSVKSWSAKEEFAWSLALRPRAVVMEPSKPQTVEVAQVYPAAYKPSQALRMRMYLTTSGKEAKAVGDLGVFAIPARDFVAEPFLFTVDLKGTPDGSYRLAAEVMDGSESVVTLQQTVAIAEGIESSAADVERRLGRIQGHDSAKASVRWPYDMARVVNLGIRKLETNDFGLTEAGTQVFDFAKEMRDSAEVLKALESGKDPLVRAKGDHERHYWFEEAREVMPYRVYVPSNWDGKKQLPMIFVLHGNTRDHNFYFDRNGGLLGKLAEKNGYLVATTMGYRPSAGYNASAITSLAPGSTSSVASGTDGSATRSAALQRETEFSEKDAVAAFELIVKEYNPDPSRIYLFGHSAGGTGGWYMGSKYPERFAGLALSAFGTAPASVPFERLKGMPLLVIVGSKDSPRLVETARTMAKAVADKGFVTQFLEMPEATHDTIVGLALPTVFEFFSKNRKQ